ncbi:GTP-binding protein Rhes isoform 1-T3 [Menidia menidia]
MNTTEKFYLPVDGILELFSSVTGHHQMSTARITVWSRALTPHSSIPKTGMGIIRTVKGCWRRQDKKVVTRRSSSSGNRQLSTDRLPKISADLAELGQTKPRNCHRIVALGAPRVGKTNILRRFLCEEYEESYEPTVEDFYRKLFRIGGEAYQVDLLDAAGERDFPAKRRLSILTGDIFLLVFSLDDRDSLNEAKELLSEIKAAKAKLLKSNSPVRVPVVVCGNKADLEGQRAVRRSEVGRLLGEDVPYFETSAKSCSGLEDAFRALAAVGGMPEDTSPMRHRVVPILAYQSMVVGGRRKPPPRGLGPPCAAVDPHARRPSFTSDLRLVLGSSTKNKKPEKCQIQ